MVFLPVAGDFFDVFAGGGETQSRWAEKKTMPESGYLIESIKFLENSCSFEHFPRNEHSEFRSSLAGCRKKAGRRLFFSVQAP